MDYIGLTEDEMIDALVNIENEIQSEKDRFRMRLRNLGVRDEEVEKRLTIFEKTFTVRKLIAENNRRIAESFTDEFDLSKKGLFI
jgi:uncharacterized protein Smg (DUF494 family)